MKTYVIKSEKLLLTYINMGRWGEIMITSQSPRYCFSSEDYKEALRDSYPSKYNDVIEEKLIPDWFYLNLPYCDECKKYIEFVDNKCSNYRSHKLLVPFNYCQKDFKTFNNRQVTRSSCCQSIEQKLKTYIFEKLKKLAIVYNKKRRKQEFIIVDLVQKVENYISQ